MATGPLNALGRHLALAGFMGAGKSTAGRSVAARLGRPLVETDDLIEQRTGRTIAELFESDGEQAFRALEADVVADALAAPDPAVVVLGGGAVASEATREALAARAYTVVLDIDPTTAWLRVKRSSRPLARDEGAFRQLLDDRRAVYDAVADGRARDVDGILLAAAGIHVELGSIDLLGELVPGRGSVEIVADRHVAGIHGIRAQLALGERDVAVHEVPQGEPAKSGAVLEHLWSALRIGRDGTIVALGGGATTDVAGLAASTYMRGVAWVAVPTSLVGQVDAAIGGKTAIDVPGAKNLVGAFHWPVRTVIDATLLATLPEEERRNGLAEVVKTGLLAGERLWELPEPDQVRRCAAFKGGVCLADPHDRGPRNQLNLGHTFAHALEAAAGYTLSHGEAVALGMLAALQLSGLEDERQMVEKVLAPRRPRLDPDAAWAAMARDKKASDGSPRLVLLDAPGKPRWGVEVPEADVRAALEELIAT